MSTICNAVFRNGKLVEASASEFPITLHLLPYYSNADHFTQERVEVLTIAEVSALRQNVAELEREIAKKDALLRECRGHLRGYKMSMLAYTPERLIAAIDAALKEQSKC